MNPIVARMLGEAEGPKSVLRSAHQERVFVVPCLVYVKNVATEDEANNIAANILHWGGSQHHKKNPSIEAFGALDEMLDTKQYFVPDGYEIPLTTHEGSWDQLAKFVAQNRRDDAAGRLKDPEYE